MKELSTHHSSRFENWFEHLFLRYGSGSQVFQPLVTSRLWNRFSWILIILGILGWISALWFLRGYAEPPDLNLNP